MGTSRSSPGPPGNSPLVPPWADDQPDQPLPPPAPKRFKPFRQSIGKFIQTGDTSRLQSALGHYARKATGGGSTATRRMGSVTTAGASLYDALTSGTSFGVREESKVSLSDLSGQQCEVAIDAIIQALTPDDGDSDKIRTAMNHALVEALEGVETFDPSHITDEVVVDTMIGYLAESVFLQIVSDAGTAWTKAETPTQAIVAENALRELVKVVVDKYMAPKFSGNIRPFSRNQIIQIERHVINEVWNEWKEYH